VRLWWLSAAIVVAACGRIDFDLARAPNDGRIVTSDGVPPDGFSGSGCLSPGIGDSFDDEITPCKAWGEPVVDNAMLNVGSGQLTITPNANAQSAGGCLLTSLPFGEAGLFVEIGQYPTIGDLQLAITDISSGNIWIIGSTNQALLDFVAPGDSTPMTIPFDATITWWRLRPSGTSVVYETSANGEAWTTQRTAPGAAPMTVGATIEDVVDDPAPGTAIIDGIDICP
jgi:hypothetical protein